MDDHNTLDSLKSRLRQFATERDWDQFHSPKNLAAALSVEAAEVLEHFQWLSEEQSRDLSPDAKLRIALELADVLLYLIRLADKLGINLLEVAARKIEINGAKYPVNRAKGSAVKYTEL